MGRRIPQPPEAFGVRHPGVDGCRVSRVCGLGWVLPPLSNSWIISIIMVIYSPGPLIQTVTGWGQYPKCRV